MLLELSKGIWFKFKFRFHGNQNQNDCLLFKKQKVYCLSKQQYFETVQPIVRKQLLSFELPYQRNLKSSEIPTFTSNSLQNFKQIKQKTPEILHFHFSVPCRIASATSYLSENKTKNLHDNNN